MKKLLSILLIMLLTVNMSSSIIFAADNINENGNGLEYGNNVLGWLFSLEDIERGSWYEPYLPGVYGIMNGISEKQFGPDMEMNRAMAVTVLYRMNNEEYMSGGCASDVFEDIEKGMWYEDSVSWAFENGIVKGTNDVIFSPYKEVTKEEFAALLYRYAQYKNKNVSMAYGKSLESYSDCQDVSTWAKEAMEWNIDKNIINGTGMELNPGMAVTRVQAAKMIYCCRYYFNFGRPYAD